MLKDAVVYLSAGSGGEAAARYAISIGEMFEAHVAGIAFAFDPVIPASVMGGISADLIEAQRAENDKTASDLAARFDKLSKAAGISAETRVLSGTLAGSADLFGHMARRFDISVVGQADPD